MGYRRRGNKLPPFVALGRDMLRSDDWRKLSANAKIVYIHLKYKFIGYNNGEIELHYSELKDMMSSATISKSFKELLNKEWIEKTEFGGLFRKRNKYKLTGKYDESILSLYR